MADEDLKVLRPKYLTRRALVSSLGVAALVLGTLWAAGSLALKGEPLQMVDDVAAERLIANETRPLVVEFVVPGCVFCKGSSRLLRQVAESTGQRVRYAQIDLSENTRLADKLGVQAVPTIIVFDKGKMRGRTAMIASTGELDELLRAR